MILPAVVGAERLVAKRRAYAWLQIRDRENEAYPELAGMERGGEAKASFDQVAMDVAKSGQENMSSRKRTLLPLDETLN